MYIGRAPRAGSLWIACALYTEDIIAIPTIGRCNMVSLNISRTQERQQRAGDPLHPCTHSPIVRLCKSRRQGALSHLTIARHVR